MTEKNSFSGPNVISEFKAQVLCCPACGGQLKEIKSGACEYCAQLLYITPNHKALKITDEMLQGINITPPTDEELKKQANAPWKIGDGSYWPTYDLDDLGGGNAIIGARLVGLYMLQHPETQLGGSRRPDNFLIEQFAIELVQKQ